MMYVDGLIIGVKSNNHIMGGMIRFEFMEMIVRIAKLRNKEMGSESEKNIISLGPQSN
jgi:hypothetical protein